MTLRCAALGLLTCCMMLGSGVAFAQDDLALQLRADNYDQTTGIWSDTSGQNNHAAINAASIPNLLPNETLNGSSAVLFRKGDLFSLSDAISTVSNDTGFTAFAYIKPTVQANGGDQALTSTGSGSGTFIYYMAGGKQNVGRQSRSYHGTSGTSLSKSDFSCINVAINGAGGGFRLNGADDGAAIPTEEKFSPIRYIGGVSNNSFEGNVAEIRVYNRRLTLAEIEAVEAELCAAYEEDLNTAPIADAGADFSVMEGQSVMLDGSQSIDEDDDPLTYAWAQVSGPTVTLSDASTAQPTFTAPQVAIGGETLSFDLTVTAAGDVAMDTVNVTVVNINHPPVADAGDDLAVAEGTLATLNGEDSFDIDSDTFTYSWVQIDNGAPIVTLVDANTANPTFVAPSGGGNGASGVVATLVFELTVDDGFPSDAPAPGYEIGDVVDSVTVEITNVNNDPTAEAGNNQTVDENSAVTLAGNGSDPDNDSLTYSWTQTGGTPVTISDAATATPGFTVPFVSPGGEKLTFELTVNDGFGGSATDTVDVNVQNANDPPLISEAAPSQSVLWPPKHGMVAISIDGVSDPDNNAMIIIDSVTQDEPTNGQGDGDTEIDAVINGDGTVFIRAERAGNGNGRVYQIHFTAFDVEGSVEGVVTVSVPHKKKQTAIDSGETFDSTQ